MKFRFLLISMCLLITAQAQLTIHHCEDFMAGTTLRFQQCDPSVLAGNSGASVTWDFSALAPMPDTTTEWIVAPAATAYAAQFPTANLVEKYSDGTFVYARTNTDSSFLVGYLDTVNGYTIRYPDPVLYALRPISYGNIITRAFSNIFRSSSFNFNGNGSCTITADAYGTLILPNGSFPNTLRLTITQTQSDTVIPGGTVTFTTTVSHIWFDDSHTSALLKIDSTQTAVGSSKTVQYLLSETTAVPQIISIDLFCFYPNPANDVVNITAPVGSVLSITNTIGQQVISVHTTPNKTALSLSGLPDGLYFMSCRTEHGVQSRSLVINH
ncbi:MAG: T9SS type A sorting domain-containing protein [Flavipsychrobacter sp.]